MKHMMIVAAVVLLSFTASAGATTYYIDAAKGDDSAAGTSVDAPWKTLDRANAALAPGDTVIVRAGTYADSRIKPVNCGSTDARITYSAYEGETPEITGGKADSPDSGVSIVDLRDRSYVTVRGFKLHSPAAHDWVVSMAGEKSHHNRIEACDVSDPQGYAPIVIAEGASYNEIVGNTAHDTGAEDEQRGDCIVLNTGAHHNVVRGNKAFNACHSQILIVRGAHDNVIEGNDCYATDPKWSGAGIDCVRNADNNIIRANRIHDLGFITAIKDAIQIDSADNTIDHNVIYNCARFGIWLESMDFRTEGQTAKNNLVANNTVYNCGRQGIYINFKRGFITHDNRFVNNIVVGSPEKFNDRNVWTAIVYTDRDVPQVTPETWFGNTFRNNVFFHEKAGEPDMFLYHAKAIDVTFSLPELEKQFPESFSGNIETAVEFVDPAKGDFRLKPGSPLIDAGIDVGLPFEGKAPDIGACEAAK